MQVKPTITNEEHIRSLPSFQLAVFLRRIADGEIKFTSCTDDCSKCESSASYCAFRIREWLIDEFKGAEE